uniref:Outer membrane protein beta-barrel domain-containing protein n=1 Tax=Chryseobacterium endophyticum TaxID=1854762 RepID=A0AAU6WSK3_9FLAO
MPNDKGVLETSYTKTKNKEDARNYNNSVNLNYEIKLDSLGSKFNANAAYLIYKRFQHSDNNTMYSDVKGSPSGFSRTGKRSSRTFRKL